MKRRRVRGRALHVLEIDTYARHWQADEDAVVTAHHDDILRLSLEDELGPMSFALPASDAAEDWPRGLLRQRSSLLDQALEYMEREVADGLPLMPQQQRRLESLAGVLSTAPSCVSPDDQGWDEHIDDAHLFALRIREAAKAVQSFAEAYLAIDTSDTPPAEQAKLGEAGRHVQAALDCFS